MHPSYPPYAPPPFSALPPPSWHPPFGPTPYGSPAACPTPHEGRIYIQNTAAFRTEPTHETPWSTGLCGCLRDPDTCIKTAFCPCITAGQIGEIVDEGKTSCLEGSIVFLLCSSILIPQVFTWYTRIKMRRRYLLKGSICEDFFAHMCCCYLALCQEYRELYNLGYDPSIGWYENAERDRRSIAVFTITPPTFQEGMTR